MLVWYRLVDANDNKWLTPFVKDERMYTYDPISRIYTIVCTVVIPKGPVNTR